MSTPILEVNGIGPATAEILAENGIQSAEDLAGKAIVAISAIKGFSETRAGQVIEAAQQLTQAPLPTKTEKHEEAPTKKKKKKPAKQKEQDKKSKKSGKDGKKDKKSKSSKSKDKKKKDKKKKK